MDILYRITNIIYLLKNKFSRFLDILYLPLNFSLLYEAIFWQFLPLSMDILIASHLKSDSFKIPSQKTFGAVNGI